MAEKTKFGSVEEYRAALTAEQRSAIDQLRKAVRAGLPEGATEVISYQIIGFRIGRGRPVLWLAAFADHYSLYPYTDALRAQLGVELEPYLSGKGTMRLSVDQPLPLDLVTRIARIRAGEAAVNPR